MNIKNHWKHLKHKKNVCGYSGTLKPRIRKGRAYKKEQCLRIYVTKKEDVSKLSKQDLLPQSIEGTPVDVVEIGEIKALEEDPKLRYRPLVAGISAMHKDGTACTLNLLFWDPELKDTLVAQNNHCAAKENKANIGDEIMQPSPYDGGKYPQDVVGRLKKFVPLHFNDFTCPYRNFFHKIYRFFSPSEPNKVDIAFFTPLVEVKQKEILGKGPITGKTIPKLGDKVWKVGRTTGYTDNGKVIDLDWNGSVQYSRGTASFTDCILISGNKFSQGGDSSSPVQKGKKNIGALFAGSSSHSIICKIHNIEKEGGVTLV